MLINIPFKFYTKRIIYALNIYCDAWAMKRFNKFTEVCGFYMTKLKKYKDFECFAG